MKARRCFARHFEARGEDGAALRKAIQIAKAVEFSVVVTDGHASVTVRGDDVTFADAQEALRQLAEIGAQRWPGERPDMQFARAFEASPELAKRAHRRPAPATSFPFPAARKAVSFQPVMVGGDALLEVDDDSPSAYEQLLELVAQQRREGETEAQTFERVYRENPRLAARERLQNRPTASSPGRQ